MSSAVLSDNAQALEDLILECGDDVAAIALPYGLTAEERATEIDLFGAAVRELRAAGWELTTRTYGAPNGSLLTVAASAAAPTKETT